MAVVAGCGLSHARVPVCGCAPPVQVGAQLWAADGGRADTCGHSPTAQRLPMKFRQSLRFTVLATALAALLACGGGGAGGGGGGNAATCEAIAQIQPPDANDTGPIAAKTKLINFEAHGQGQLDRLGNFINDLRAALAVAPLGQAAAAFAAADDEGNGPISGGRYLTCATPGTLTITGSTYTFSGCVVNGYRVDGQASLSAVGASTHTLTFSGIGVTLPGSSQIAISGSADCTVTAGAVPKCVAELDPIATLSTETYRYGWNATYSDSPVPTASGTHGCGCTDTWLVTLDNCTATSGTALIQVSNGSALIRRNSANLWDAELTETGGQTIVFRDIPTN